MANAMKFVQAVANARDSYEAGVLTQSQYMTKLHELRAEHAVLDDSIFVPMAQ